MREPVNGVLLAGGLSRRMGGGDKCLLELGKTTLLENAANRLAPQVLDLVLNANGDPARFAHFNLTIIADSVEGYAGPLAGILSGMIWSRQYYPDQRWIVTAATDAPFFPKDLVEKLRAAVATSYPAISLASSNGRVHPVFGLWPTVLAEDLDDALRGGVRKLLDWTDRHTLFTHDFSDTEEGQQTVDPFFNVNRPEDLVEAEKLLQGQAR